MKKHDLGSWMRRLWYWFENHGINRGDRGAFISMEFESEKIRKQAWLYDSLLWGMEELEAGRLRLAYRGLIEAAQHAEVVGHDHVTGDAFTVLKIACEDTLNDIYQERDTAIAVMQDCLEDSGQHRPYRGER